jgi:hypothetical protein
VAFFFWNSEGGTNMSLERMIHLYNDDNETFTGRWDGRNIEIESGSYAEVQAGIAEHFISRHPDAKLRVEEIAGAAIEPRTPVNPLEQSDRGEAFAAVRRRKKASGE